jgi:cyclopropane fatty-acyl-phospholipid synthase-like methyltransferase
VNERYHTSRFGYDPRRRVLWQTLAACVFQRHIAADATVLDLGAGYGEWINAIRARKRMAVDVWDGMLDHLDDGVEGLITSVTDLSAIADDSVDHVFSSNCFEHLSSEDMARCLVQVKRKMKRGATLDIIQPNFRYCFREYFDDYTHVTIYTDVGLSDLLVSNGFTVTHRARRFLPLSLKSGFPVHPLLIRLYLWSPLKPRAKQMWIRATR